MICNLTRLGHIDFVEFGVDLVFTYDNSILSDVINYLNNYLIAKKMQNILIEWGNSQKENFKPLIYFNRRRSVSARTREAMIYMAVTKSE